MITVRFPNGQAVQYNDANWAEAWGSNHVLISRKQGDGWLALIPATCIVEISAPCRVYNALAEMPADVHTRLRKMDAKISRALRKPK